MPIGQWGLQSDEQNQRYNMQANEMNVRGQEQLGSAIGQAPQKFLQGAQQVQQMQSQKLQNQLMIAKYEQDKQELAWKMNVTAQTQQLRATEIGLQANAHALEKDKFLFNQERSKAQDKRDMGEWDLHVFEANEKAGVHKDDKGYFRSVWKDNKSQSEYLSPEESAQYQEQYDLKKREGEAEVKLKENQADFYDRRSVGGASGKAGEAEWKDTATMLDRSRNYWTKRVEDLGKDKNPGEPDSPELADAKKNVLDVERNLAAHMRGRVQDGQQQSSAPDLKKKVEDSRANALDLAREYLGETDLNPAKTFPELDRLLEGNAQKLIKSGKSPEQAQILASDALKSLFDRVNKKKPLSDYDKEVMAFIHKQGTDPDYAAKIQAKRKEFETKKKAPNPSAPPGFTGKF